MKKLILIRSYLDNCALGKMYFEGEKICYTVEKPWCSNKPFKSCIPSGEYKIERHHSEKYKDAFILSNLDLGVGKNEGDSVRFACLIHVANFPDDVVGCIGPGMALHPDRWGVARSKDAMQLLNTLIDLSEDWTLEII